MFIAPIVLNKICGAIATEFERPLFSQIVRMLNVLLIYQFTVRYDTATASCFLRNLNSTLVRYEFFTRALVRYSSTITMGSQIVIITVVLKKMSGKYKYVERERERERK